jgi:outer membrane protein assembly factor BamB
VVAFFGSEGLYAFDHEGNVLWSRDFGVLDAGAPTGAEETDGYQWGFASSPILFEDKVIVQCDIQGESFLSVLDAETGKDVWRVTRDEPPTWCTPAVHEVAADGKRQIILNGYRHIGGYDLDSGKELWKLVGGGDVPVPTPVVADGLIYITSAHGRVRPIYAIHVDAEGLLEANARASEGMEWCHLNRGVYMQTPLVEDGLLYCCSDGGILAVFDAQTGDGVYRERLGGGTSGFSGSAVQSEDRIYFTAEGGTVHVVRAGPEFEELARNELGETCLSTPAISEGRLFFRTRAHLVCVKP